MDVGNRRLSCAPVLLLGVLLLTPLMVVNDGPWREIRVLAVQGVAITLLIAAVASSGRSPGGYGRYLRTSSSAAVIALIVWAGFSFAMQTSSSDRGRGLAVVELLRLCCGAAVYFGAQSLCRSSRHMRLVVWMLLGAVITIAAASLGGFLPTSGGFATASLGDTQLFGAFLVGLVPVAAAFALRGLTTLQRLTAGIAVVLAGSALLSTGTRSSWAGAVFGLVLITILDWRARRLALKESSSGRGGRRQVSIGMIGVTGSIAVCLTLSTAGGRVVERAKTLGTIWTDSSVTTRLETWKTSVDIIARRPVAGWGIGSFPLVLGEFHRQIHSGSTAYPVPSAAYVEAHGVGLSSMAHSEYLQISAELGLTGLALYIGVLVSFFSGGIACMLRKTDPVQRAVLLATLGAVAAQAVDGVANPGWRFREVSILLWLMLGLGVAAMQSNALTLATSSRARAKPLRAHPHALHRALVASAVALLLAVAVNRVGSSTLLAATGLPQVSAVADINSLFGFTIVAKTGDTIAGEGMLSYIANYVSINDVGNVAFVGSVPVNNPITGAREHRGNVYLGGEQPLENITVGTNNNLAPTDPHIYSYGPVQINNDNAIVAALDRVSTPRSVDPAVSSVTVWWPTDGVGPYVPAPVISALAKDLRFAGVSISNGGGSDALRKPGLGRVAFAAQTPADKQTALVTNATVSGLFASDLSIRSIQLGDQPFFPIPLFPMIADSGRIVLKSGNVAPNFRVTPDAFPGVGGVPGVTNSIRFYGLSNDNHFFTNTPAPFGQDDIPVDGRDYAPYPLSRTPGDPSQFSSLGSMPGISDDGLIAVFKGTLTESGAEVLNEGQEPFIHLSEGPGIFALITTRRGNRSTDGAGNTYNEGRMLVRVAGIGGNGQFDPGEILEDRNGNGVFDAALNEDSGPRFREFLDRERVGVNNLGTVVYTAVDADGEKGLYVSRLNVYAVTASVDPPVLLVRQRDSIPGLRGTVQDIRLYDSVNNRGDGDIAFWVRMSDPFAADPANRDTEAIVRARPKGCERAVKPSGLAALEVSGHGWTMRPGPSERDGIVVYDVALGSRYLARQMSVPYLNVSVAKDGDAPGPTRRVELLPSALIDYQERTEADKFVVTGTYAVADLLAGSPDCLLVTQRYEFHRPEPDDHGAPGLDVFQHPVARFMPIVQYVFIGDQSVRIPHDPTHATIEAVQRLHFKPDHFDNPFAGSAVAIFQDTLLASDGSFDSPIVPLLGNPLPREQILTAIRGGTAGDWDNFHQTIQPTVELPIPGVIPGCVECIHIHWRWAELASYFFGNVTFGFGEPLIPAGSAQSVTVGVSRRHNDDSPMDFRRLFDPEEVLNQYPSGTDFDPYGIRFEPVMWYAGSSRDDHDAFFTHGGHFSVPPLSDDDTISPSTSAVATPAANSAGWHTSDVTVTLSANDSPTGSGVDGITYSVTGAQTIPTTTVPTDGASITISAEGVSTITFFASDLAGNVESANTVTVRLDKTPPTITNTQAPAPNSSGWNNTPVTITFQCADALSGLAEGSPPAPRLIATEGANQSGTGVCSDVAGHTVASTRAGINIDLSPPAITLAVSSAVLWPANGKAVPVTLSGRLSDTLSGLDSSGASFRVLDEYGIIQPGGDITLSPDGTFSSTFALEARRLGQDRDGRRYDVIVNVRDKSGNARSASVIVTVPHDLGK